MLALIKRFFCLLSSHYKVTLRHIFGLFFLDMDRTSWRPDLVELSKFLFTVDGLIRHGTYPREINNNQEPCPSLMGAAILVFFLSPQDFQSFILQRHRQNELILLPVYSAVMSDCSLTILRHMTCQKAHKLLGV